MQKIGIFYAASTFILLAALLFIGTHTRHTKKNALLNVTVTTNIIADAVQQIAGDTVALHCLMQPGIDPHSYHARLSDLRALLSADVIIHNGLHLEGKMAGVLEKMKTIPGVIVCAAAEALSTDLLIRSDEFEGIYDPHIWFDVSLWKQVVTYIAGQLCIYNPQYQKLYRERLQAYTGELDALDAYIRSHIATVDPTQRFLITTHDAFSYFGRAYGVAVIGLQGVNLDAEPCIKNMHELTTLICTHNIPTVFVESSLPHRSMQAITHAVRAQGQAISIGDELYSDTLGPAGSNAGSYVGMVMHNTHALVRGLKSLYTMT